MGYRVRTGKLGAGLATCQGGDDRPNRTSVQEAEMKITGFETFPVSVPYTHEEVTSRLVRGGVSVVIVKLTTDDGLVGWGECCGNPDAAVAEAAAKYCAAFVVGRDPWQTEAIAHDVYKKGSMDRRFRLANHVLAGIDQALWDLCGKACGQPVYRFFGGALREEVEYFCYLARGTPEDLERQCRDALERGYGVFYLKVGIDTKAETEMLEAVRGAIGPDARIRIDVNEAWDLRQAVRILNDWDSKFEIDFCEAPVPHDLPDSMREVRERVSCALCANDSLGREIDVLRIIRGRCAEVLCFSPYWLGSLRRFMTMSHVAHLEGLTVCKHTFGELGLAAAASQHLLLCIPNADPGNQQTAAFMTDDILAQPVPIASGPKWGLIEAPGLGVEVDEEKLARYHEAYLRDGPFKPFREA